MVLLDERKIIRESVSGTIILLQKANAEWASGVVAKLKALDINTVTREQVYAINPNSFLEPTSCDECGEDSGKVIRFGEKSTTGRATYLCEECLKNALSLFKE